MNQTCLFDKLGEQFHIQPQQAKASIKLLLNQLMTCRQLYDKLKANDK